MTFNEFLVKLKAKNLTWKVCLVLGAIRSNVGGSWHCPISALTGDQEDLWRATAAGVEVLGLKKSVARRIVRAADDNAGPRSATRKALLEACGL